MDGRAALLMAGGCGCGGAGVEAGVAGRPGSASSSSLPAGTPPPLPGEPPGAVRFPDWSVDPRNVLSAQNRRLRALEALQRRLGDPSGWADGADREIRVRGQMVGTWRQLFTALREAGVRPHGYGEDDDGFVAAVLHSVGKVARDRVRGPSEGAGGLLPDLEGLAPPEAIGMPEPWSEEAVAPDERLGVTEGAYPRTSSVTGAAFVSLADYAGRTEGERKWGAFVDMVVEVAAMGAGRVRRVKSSDVYYGGVFPEDDDDYYPDGSGEQADFWLRGAMVRPPAELLAAMQADRFARMTPMTEMLCACLAAGVRLTLTPFNHGGGGGLNHQVSAGDTAGSPGPCVDEASGEVCAGTPRWSELEAGAPAWQTTWMVPSGEGWAAWYHSGALADGFTEAQAPGADDDPSFHRYVLQLYPAREEENREGSSAASAYALECARRKCLGLAAFAEGVGAWLAGVDGACRSLGRVPGRASGLRVTDVVDLVDLGNELDAFYRNDAEEGAREAGRYMALLAGPIHRRVPGIRFRAAELGSLDPEILDATSSGTPRSFEQQCDFLAQAVRAVADEVAWWARVLRGDRTDADVDAWLDTGAAAGWAWPPALSTLGGRWVLGAPSLVHHVGFHWFRCFNRDPGYRPPAAEDLDHYYQDAAGLAAALRTFDERVVTPLEAEGFRLERTVGAIGFPAYDPGEPGDHRTRGCDDPEPARSTSWDTHAYAGTSTALQAAMLVRHVAWLRALGVAQVGVFSFGQRDVCYASEGPPHAMPAWKAFDGMGLHNELYDASAGGSYRRGRQCWRRPAWYALRRLSYILRSGGAGAEPPEVLHDGEEDGLVVLRFPVGGLGLGLEGATWTGTERTPTHAWLAWLDQYAAAEEGWVDLWSSDVLDVEVAGLVPTVPAVTPWALASEDGYREVRVDWSAHPAGAVPEAVESGVFHASYNHLRRWRIPRASASSPQPALLLSRASFLDAGV